MPSEPNPNSDAGTPSIDVPAEKSANESVAPNETAKPDPADTDNTSSSTNRSKYVTIDGADEEDAEDANPDLKDPLESGLILRWLMPRDGFGITDLELGNVDHRPHFPDHTRWNFGIPFAVSFVDEPQALGIPSELYSVQIDTRWIQPLDEKYGFDVSVAPGWFSDFDAGSNNGFRVTGHGMATMYVSDELQVALGAMYLGRDDVKILPAGGLVWAIRPDTRLELVMPKPRVTHTLSSSDGVDRSIYLGFELWGGNTWAVTRPDYSYDSLTYRDFRFVAGHEVRGKMVGGVVEVGYAFGRKLEFRDDPATLRPDGTLLLRIGSTY